MNDLEKKKIRKIGFFIREYIKKNKSVPVKLTKIQKEILKTLQEGELHEEKEEDIIAIINKPSDYLKITVHADYLIDLDLITKKFIEDEPYYSLTEKGRIDKIWLKKFPLTEEYKDILKLFLEHKEVHQNRIGSGSKTLEKIKLLEELDFICEVKDTKYKFYKRLYSKEALEQFL